MISRRATLTTLFAITLIASAGFNSAQADFRPPSVPLVTYNPFLSIWSPADHLNDADTLHWTHHKHALTSLIRIDGVTSRLMGAAPQNLPPFPQKSLKVTATRSLYEFEGSGIHITMTFLEPALPDDLDVYSWPLNYITWDVRSTDGKNHQVELYESTSSQLAVNKPDELVNWQQAQAGPLTTLRVGTVSQPILRSSGDDHRINWGYAYTAAQTTESTAKVGLNTALEESFIKTGSLSQKEEKFPQHSPASASVMAFAFDLGKVGSETIQRQVLVAYDEIYAISYFGKMLPPYWARNGISIGNLLQKASLQYPSLLDRCKAFDKELQSDLEKVGGPHYAEIASLAYRQVVAACGLAADAHGQPLFFTKENTSNGDIATVDVFMPMDPLWIFLSPSLAKASLVHILMYAASHHWKFPNAPHDLGTYPIAPGRDGGGEAMPVEESGNMLILCDAISQADGNTDFVKPWWPQLTQWAKYLEQYGLDPEDQLCTDDFMGHLAHNSNLSIKAILGLAAYGDMCRLMGDKVNAQKYSDLAKVDAAHWIKVSNDGDHYRLAFDKPGTWSQKYNLVWDRILNLNVFPQEVADKEIAFYLTQMQPYGLPLDSRTKLGDADHLFFTATMARDPKQFDQLIDPFYAYLNQTTVRDPLSDTYQTTNVKIKGMHARPVVGGIFIKMLSDRDAWKKWASRDKLNPSNWAPLPDEAK